MEKQIISSIEEIQSYRKLYQNMFKYNQISATSLIDLLSELNRAEEVRFELLKNLRNK